MEYWNNGVLGKDRNTKIKDVLKIETEEFWNVGKMEVCKKTRIME